MPDEPVGSPPLPNDNSSIGGGIWRTININIGRESIPGYTSTPPSVIWDTEEPDISNIIRRGRAKIIDKKNYEMIKDAIDDAEIPKDIAKNRVIIDSDFNYGYTRFNLNEGNAPIVYYSGQLFYIKSEQLAKELSFVEDIYQGIWFYKTEKESIRSVSEHFTYKRDVSLIEKNKLKYGEISNTFIITEGKRYSFGIEFEAAIGWVPYYMAKDYNISCMRDGSLNAGRGGAEFVTGVMLGDNGFKHLHEICNLLTSRCKLDKFCSTHIHLGNFQFNKESIIALYKLCTYIENDILEIVPQSRRSNDYCKALPRMEFRSNINIQSQSEYEIAIEQDYNDLYDMLAVKKSNLRSTGLQHPLGAKCGYNRSTPRYCWVNFIPAMFNTRGNKESKTIEIRIHSATVNYTKTKNWLLIWMGVLWFVDNYKYRITPDIRLEDIILKAYPRNGDNLIKYIHSRRELFKNSISESAEYIKESPEDNKTLKELCV